MVNTLILRLNSIIPLLNINFNIAISGKQLLFENIIEIMAKLGFAKTINWVWKPIENCPTS